MRKRRKEKPVNKYIVKQSRVCDRCGNDLLNGKFLIHLPFRKKYITLCGICQFGLMYGYHRDLVRDEKGGE